MTIPTDTDMEVVEMSASPDRPPVDRSVRGEHPEQEPSAIPPSAPRGGSRDPVSWTLTAGGLVLVLVVVLIILLIV